MADSPESEPKSAAIASPAEGFNSEYDDDPDDYIELQAYHAQKDKAAAPAEEAKPAEAKPEDQPAAAPAKPVHPASLVERARALGVPAAEIDSLSTADLRAEVSQQLEFQKLQFARQQSAARPQPQSPAPAPVAEKPAEADPLAALTEDEYDPKLVAALRHLSERLGKVSGLESKFEEFHQREVARESAATQKRMDELFARHEAVYGGKATRALPDDSPELLRRSAVYARLQALAQAGKLTDLDADFDAAHAALYGSVVAPQPTAGATITEALGDKAGGDKPVPPKDPTTGRFVKADADDEAARREAWMKGTLPMPTQRRDAELPPGPEAAKRYVAERLRAMGKSVDD